MRSLLFSSLLVGCLAATFAFADDACVNNAELAYSYCDGNYTALNQTTATRAETCTALSEFVRCLGQLASCDVQITSGWINIVNGKQEDWMHYGCDMAISNPGSARSAMVWGDPHYSMFGGAYASCQNVGQTLLASGLYWSVTATFEAYNNEEYNNGSFVSDVIVRFFHPAIPTSNNTFAYSIDDGVPSAGTAAINEEDAYTITVTNSSVTAPGFGVTVFIELIEGSFFQVGIVSRSVVGGDLLTGCAVRTEISDDARSFKQADDISDLCAQLSGDFKTSCVYDAPRMGSYLAVMGSAQAQIFSVTTIREEMERQNGNGAATHATWLLAAVSTLVGIVMLW